MPEPPVRRRAAEAFRALDTGSALAQHRVWLCVERELAERRRLGRRRLAWAAGIATTAAAAIALVLPGALGAARSFYEPSQQQRQQAAIAAVVRMLGDANGTGKSGTNGLSDVVRHLAAGTDAGAR